MQILGILVGGDFNVLVFRYIENGNTSKLFSGLGFGLLIIIKHNINYRKCYIVLKHTAVLSTYELVLKDNYMKIIDYRG